jgi:uncharacterized protein YigE (DUF2233 family)
MQLLSAVSKRWLLLLSCAIALGLVFARRPTAGSRFVSYEAYPRQQLVQLFYRDERGRRFGSIERLRVWLAQRHYTLVFAMNGGMYSPGGVPKGLFIERGRMVTPLDTGRGPGNFYLRPNGIFYLTTGQRAGICATGQFRDRLGVAYATQSGPLLLVGGQVNPLFKPGSNNVVVRNGVGQRPDGRLVFAMSSEPVNLYDFATYFKDLGCREALYLDGFVSRLYLPTKNWQQTDGDFGVIVGVARRTAP